MQILALDAHAPGVRWRTKADRERFGQQVATAEADARHAGQLEIGGKPVAENIGFPAPLKIEHPTPASGSTGGKKRGLAYNDPSLLPGFLGGNSKVSWMYNWGQSDDSGGLGIEYVAMLWGTGSNHVNTWANNAEKALAAGSKHLLSFNEPDNAGQANMSPQDAAAGHIQYLNPYGDRARIGSPAITNSGNPGEGISWIKGFFSACGGQCKVDFVPIHWYSPADPQGFLQHLLDVYAAVNLPIWITEFAPFGSDDQINSFLQTVMTAMDTDPKYSFVERYSYFMVGQGSLISSGKSL